jgi:hypothetical protein
LTRARNRVKAGSISTGAGFRAENLMRGLLLAFLALTAGPSGGAVRSRPVSKKTSAKTTATAV